MDTSQSLIPNTPSTRFARWTPALLVLGLSLFHAVNNWIWLSKNLIPEGWDRIGALVNSLYYHRSLSGFSLQALFRAVTQDEYRPPLFGLSMAMMYRLFGVSADVAVMANVIYMVVLLAASYGIGVRLGGRQLGMWSSVVVALIPLVFAMSRYSYSEFALTALVALSLCSLLASQRFERKSWSLVLGGSLGLGLLTKQIFVVYLLGAVGVAFLQAGLPRRLWLRLRAGPRPRWQEVGLALGGGLLLSALWYFPNREAVQAWAGGTWLFLVWWVLVAGAIFFAVQPSSPETNFLACCFVALSLASAWYLPHVVEFVRQILWLAWGIRDPRQRTVDFSDPATYTAYLQSALYAFSPVYTLLLLLAAAVVGLTALWQRRRLLPARGWNWPGWTLVGSLLIAYAILTTSIYKEHRAITPLLPVLGVMLAGVLLALPWRRLRLAILGLVVTFGLVQFLAISYTGFHGLVDRTTFGRRILGQPGLFAQGQYLETPDSGRNDPRFWITGDVLQRVEATRQRQGWDALSLGVIAYSSHMHVGMLAYEQLLHYPAIRLDDPTQSYPHDSPYSTAFRYDYVLVLENKNRRPAVREGEMLILKERRSFFDQAFEEEATYPLPDGSIAHLFRRRYRPAEEYDASSLYQAAGYVSQTAKADDLVMVAPPDLTAGFLAYYWGPAPLLSLGQAQAQGLALAGHPHLFLVAVQGSEEEVHTFLQERYGPAMEGAPFGELQVTVYEPWK